ARATPNSCASPDHFGVVDLVVQAGIWRADGVGVSALAEFARDSRCSLPPAGIREPDFPKRAGAPGVREIRFSRRNENVAAPATRGRRRAHVGFRVNNIRRAASPRGGRLVTP